MEAALKLFKTATGRRTVLSFSGAYHGMTHGALALTGNLSAKQEVAGLMPDVHFLPYPYSYRCPFGLGAAGAQTSLEYISEPDAVLLSKAIGGGYPLSVLLYHEKYDRWQAGAHAGTFRGNQMAMVAGTAVMEVLLEQDLVATVRDKGAYLQAALTHLAQTYPEIGDVRGRGLMWGLEIVDPRSEPDPRLGSRPAELSEVVSTLELALIATAA